MSYVLSYQTKKVNLPDIVSNNVIEDQRIEFDDFDRAIVALKKVIFRSNNRIITNNRIVVGKPTIEEIS